MSNKARCLCLSHHQETDNIVFLHVELDDKEIQIPITANLIDVQKNWMKKHKDTVREVLSELSVAMPKYIEVVEIEGRVELSDNQFGPWWDVSRHINDPGILLNHHLEVYGPEYAKSPWYKCYPLCYANPCPITAAEAAKSYIREKVAANPTLSFGGKAFPSSDFDKYRDLYLQFLRIPGGYINAYSFSRKEIADTDVAIALGFDKLFGINAEHDYINLKYGLFFK